MTAIVLGGLQELRGIIAALKCVVRDAAREAEEVQNTDPIDWVGMETLVERAGVIILDMEEAAEKAGGAP